MNKFSRTVLATGALAAAMGLAAPALADTNASTEVNGHAQTSMHHGWGFGIGLHFGDHKSVVFGTVSSVSGTTLVVSEKDFPRPGPKPEANENSGAMTTSYTIDASNATVYKGSATSTLSAIAVGDTVMVEGTVNGTSVTAKTIRDGFPQMAKPGEPRPAPVIKGDGQPVVGGSVTAISGSTISITNASNVSYTVDASSATIVRGNATSTLSGIAVGDTLIVQGAVNGSSITASSVIDSSAKASASDNGKGHGFIGFFAGIGGFFAHLFGF